MAGLTTANILNTKFGSVVQLVRMLPCHPFTAEVIIDTKIWNSSLDRYNAALVSLQEVGQD